jgi:hypothetical protein
MAQGMNGAYSHGRELKDSRHAACGRSWNKLRCEHGKMSVDFSRRSGSLSTLFVGKNTNQFRCPRRTRTVLLPRDELLALPLADPSAASVISKRKEPAVGFNLGARPRRCLIAGELRRRSPRRRSNVRADLENTPCAKPGEVIETSLHESISRLEFFQQKTSMCSGFASTWNSKPPNVYCERPSTRDWRM